jgi:hypothetical protein
MEVPMADTHARAAAEPPKQAPKKQAPAASRVPSIVVGLVVVAVAGRSIWFLVRGEPLLVQGEADATRLDIAARVDGRVAEIPVERGQNVAAGAVLVKIDNPETLAKNEQAYTWSKGKAIYAAGVQFAPVHYDGQAYLPGQANNFYIFPAVGMAIFATQAKQVSDEMQQPLHLPGGRYGVRWCIHFGEAGALLRALHLCTPGRR